MLKRTPLYELQKRAGAKFVDFHGWELPLHYGSILQEHHAVRRGAGLFDISHMGRFWIRGPGAFAFLQKTTSNDFRRAPVGRALYTHLLNERGGVMDDVVVFCLRQDVYGMVVNAGRRQVDWEWLRTHTGKAQMELEDVSEESAMLGLQGPSSPKLLEGFCPSALALKRFGVLQTQYDNQRLLVSRTGYTGEDGFEWIVSRSVAPSLWERLLALGEPGRLRPCGLGARDTLRLEAGYLLYGADIDEEHTPLEAGYDWVVRWDKGSFIGREALERQRENGFSKKIRGVKLLEKGVLHAGASVLFQGKGVGKLTSGSFSPSLGVGIGMGYLEEKLPAGARVEVEVRGRRLAAEVVPLPFYAKGK
ncbi:MAG: glycine cleavage system aminomethyltransferase GcvT [Elusimicrobia bacterium]|nr:glycine cleavage system aminomethyltransferase GcvT [Elusimicrobiota bacterium]